MRLSVATWAIGSVLLGSCATQPYANDVSDVDALLIFHNNSGPMCLAALEWLDATRSEHPALVIEEHLTYEAGETELLAELEAQFQMSQGVSTSFEYLPIMFFQEQAFSGFDDEISEALQELLLSAESASRRSSATQASRADATVAHFVLDLPGFPGVLVYSP